MKNNVTAATLKIEVKTENRTDGKTVTEFYINGVKHIASVINDFNNIGKYSGYCGTLGACNNVTYPEAIEFVSDCIERHFAEFGINIEFVTE